jgi:hypothetical protein
VYRYAAGSVVNANSYAWTLPSTFQGGAVTVDSGNAAYSQVIRVKYSSNSAAGTLDSIAVRPYNGCSSGAVKAYKLINTALNPPAAPTITFTTVVGNLCGGRIVRYVASTPKLNTANTVASTGYYWTLPVGAIGATCVIDSGTLSGPDARVIRIRYLSNGKANLDTVKVAYTSACGNSLPAKSAVTLPALNPPSAPAAPSIVKIADNSCAKPRYRYTGPALVAATTSTGAASGYDWQFQGTLLGLPGNYIIDSGSLSSPVFTVEFQIAAASSAIDSIRLRYTSDCGYGAWRSAKIPNTLSGTNAPSAPTSITMTLVRDSCGARTYRYSAPNLTAANTINAAATGWQWAFIGTLYASGARIDSGTLTSQRLLITYNSNASAATGDSAKVRFTSACGTSVWKAQKLSNVTKTGCPPPVTVSKGVNNQQTNESDELKVTIFPNPSAHYFNLMVRSLKSAIATEVRIMDMQGRELKRNIIMPGESWSFGSELKPGAYIAELLQGDKVKLVRFIRM